MSPKLTLSLLLIATVSRRTQTFSSNFFHSRDIQILDTLKKDIQFHCTQAQGQMQ